MLALIVAGRRDLVAQLKEVVTTSGWAFLEAETPSLAIGLATDSYNDIRVALVDEELANDGFAETEFAAGSLCQALYNQCGVNTILVLEPRRLLTEDDRFNDGNRIAELQLSYRFHDYFYRTSNKELLRSSLSKLYSDALRSVSQSRRDRFIRHASGLFGKNSIDDNAIAALSVNPERLYHPHSEFVRFYGLASARPSSSLAVVFHALSPCGDGISLLASLGRDLALCRVYGIPCIRYCIQGPAWASLNHTVRSIRQRCSGSPHDEELVQIANCRRSFLRRFDRRRLPAAKLKNEALQGFPLVECRVVDIVDGMEIDDISCVTRSVEAARTALNGAFPSGVPSDRNEATRRLDSFEKECAAAGRYADVTAVKSLKGALSVSADLDEATLRYYFAQNCYLDVLGTNVIRLGPFLERSWDSAFESLIRSDNYRTYCGVYFKEYALADGWGLPYSFVSGNTFASDKSGALRVESLLFVGDSEAQISRCLAGAPHVEARRFISDLISFAQHAALFDEEVASCLELLPETSFSDSMICPGSPRAMSWIRRACQVGNAPTRDECPAFLVPFILTHLEWRDSLPELCRFVWKIGEYAAQNSLPRRNSVLLSQCFGG